MILFLIVFVIIPIILKLIDNWFDLEGYFDYCICVVIPVLIVETIVFIGTSQVETELIYEEKQYNICGLENKTTQDYSLNGTFILGCGKIVGETNNEEYYVYFKENEYGKILEKLPIDKVYIREKEDIKPSLINIMKKTKYKRHPILSKIFLFIGVQELHDSEIVEKTGTILEVPVGTIKIEYNVDI